jgi:hypothetical protein
VLVLVGRAGGTRHGVGWALLPHCAWRSSLPGLLEACLDTGVAEVQPGSRRSRARCCNQPIRRPPARPRRSCRQAVNACSSSTCPVALIGPLQTKEPFVRCAPAPHNATHSSPAPPPLLGRQAPVWHTDRAAGGGRAHPGRHRPAHSAGALAGLQGAGVHPERQGAVLPAAPRPSGCAAARLLLTPALRLSWACRRRYGWHCSGAGACTCAARAELGEGAALLQASRS